MEAVWATIAPRRNAQSTSTSTPTWSIGAKAGIENLSAHVESLLAQDLGRRETRAAREKANTDLAIDAFAEYYSKHGSLSEQLEGE